MSFSEREYAELMEEMASEGAGDGPYSDRALTEQVRYVLESVRMAWVEQNELVRGLLGADTAVDEMALLFGSELSVATFVRFAVQEQGYCLFNTATDTVQTEPLRDQYDVTYWFLGAPGWLEGQGYRLELMALRSAGSALHNNRLRSSLRITPEMGAVPVHASFKCKDESQYAGSYVALKNGGYEVVQRCRSSYGSFSYWQPFLGEETAPEWYLKPRLNRRDTEALRDV
jgi:hypothetical protein